jgi:4-hydroxy-2-oxoheptanedioate aldolase
VSAPQRPSLRARVLRGDAVVGVIVKMPAAASVEMCAAAGFDFVVLDAEHGGGEMLELEHHIRAAESFGIPALVRVGYNDPAEILHALDAGAVGIIVPHVCTAADARAAVQAAHYPPLGRRGLALTTRAGRHTFTDLRAHLARARSDTLVIVQVEDAEAFEHVREVAATPHVDVVFLGPTDLSLSLGHPGAFDHPVVAEAVETFIEAVRREGGAALGTFARDEADTLSWRARGASFIFLAATLLFAQRLKQVKGALEEAERTSPSDPQPQSPL